MFTVAKLMRELASMVQTDPKVADMPVYLSRDEEGNGFKPLYTHMFGRTEGEHDDMEFGADQENNALVLWP